MDTKQIVEALEAYKGDNIWEDVIYQIDGFDEAATEAAGTETNNTFVAGGILFTDPDPSDQFGSWTATEWEEPEACKATYPTIRDMAEATIFAFDGVELAGGFDMEDFCRKVSAYDQDKQGFRLLPKYADSDAFFSLAEEMGAFAD